VNEIFKKFGTGVENYFLFVRTFGWPAFMFTYCYV